MFRTSLFILLVTPLFFFQACKKDPATACEETVNELKINQIQTLGSHNSYRKAMDTSIFNFLVSVQAFLPADAQPDDLDYCHLPLTQQLTDYGVRNFEIDVFHDPDGGQYYNRTGKSLIGEPEASNVPELQNPGLKVLHTLDVDFNTHHYTFVDALQTLKTWSDNHRNHLPLFIYIEPKTKDLTNVFIHHWTSALPFSDAFADSIDLEINAVFGADADQVITPDEVRGSYSTLEEAVLAGNWPTLAEARGKILFIVSHRDYKNNHPSLAGRVAFLFDSPGNPECAFVLLNDPITDQEKIKEYVGMGYIVRTRTDVATVEARSGDYTRMEAAFSSGAQLISTDYYRSDPRADTSAQWTDFKVAFPNGVLARGSTIAGAILEDGCLITE